MSAKKQQISKSHLRRLYLFCDENVENAKITCFSSESAFLRSRYQAGSQREKHSILPSKIPPSLLFFIPRGPTCQRHASKSSRGASLRRRKKGPSQGFSITLLKKGSKSHFSTLWRARAKKRPSLLKQLQFEHPTEFPRATWMLLTTGAGASVVRNEGARTTFSLRSRLLR